MIFSRAFWHGTVFLPEGASWENRRAAVPSETSVRACAGAQAGFSSRLWIQPDAPSHAGGSGPSASNAESCTGFRRFSATPARPASACLPAPPATSPQVTPCTWGWGGARLDGGQTQGAGTPPRRRARGWERPAPPDTGAGSVPRVWGGGSFAHTRSGEGEAPAGQLCGRPSGSLRRSVFYVRPCPATHRASLCPWTTGRSSLGGSDLVSSFFTSVCPPLRI